MNLICLSASLRFVNVIREIIQKAEELGIQVKPIKLINAYSFKRNNKEFLILNYYCKITDEPMKSEEHSELRWVDPQTALELFSYPKQRMTVQEYIIFKKTIHSPN